MTPMLLTLGAEILKGAWGYLRGNQEKIAAGAAAKQALQARLAGRGADWLLLVVWAVWMAPVIHAYFDPAAVERSIAALQALPEYVTETARWLTIFAAGYPLVPRIKR